MQSQEWEKQHHLLVGQEQTEQNRNWKKKLRRGEFFVFCYFKVWHLILLLDPEDKDTSLKCISSSSPFELSESFCQMLKDQPRAL